MRLLNIKIALVFVVVMLFICAPVCLAEDVGVDFYNTVSVFEFEIILNENTGSEKIPVISLTKGDISVVFLWCDTKTGELLVSNKNGDFCKLYDAYRKEIAIDTLNITEIAIIYDDLIGETRYCINGQKVWYSKDGLTFEARFFVSDEFRDSDAECVVSSEDGLKNSYNAYNINKSGTAEVIAFQCNDFTDSVRILAGVNMLYYDSIGFEVNLYCDGSLISGKTVKTQSVFESLVANDKNVYAYEHNFKYFAALEISGIKLDEEKEYYAMVLPYSVIGDEAFYGSPSKINIEKETYSFDKSFKYVEYAENPDFFDCEDTAVSITDTFAGGDAFFDFSATEATVATVVVDGEAVDTVELKAGRSSYCVTSIENGKHTVKISGPDMKKVSVRGVSYLVLPHEHSVSSSSAWSISDEKICVTCSECGESISVNISSSPAFNLTFENSVSTEAAQYTGFSVVKPSGYSIGTDTDGDKALNAKTSYYYIDAEQATLAAMPYYRISFDLTVIKTGDKGAEISLFTIISNFRNGAKVSGKTANYAYLFKYNVNQQKLSTVKVGGNTDLLTEKNSMGINVGQQYKITAIIDNINLCAHVFVDGNYIYRNFRKGDAGRDVGNRFLSLV